MIKKNTLDPRLPLFSFLILYTIYALMVPSFNRNIYQMIYAMGTCAIVDYLLLRYYKKISIFPFSGIISSFGIFLMCNSPHVFLYILLPVIAIFSKHFIVDSGRHVFNPNNFALVIGVLFFQNDMTIVAGVWGGHAWTTATIITFGIILIFYANRANLVLAFLTSFVVFATLRSHFLHVPLSWTMLPLFGPSFFLFLFYMLTDPKTTPNKTSDQVLFGILLAICDAAFRYYKNKYAPILSLFILTAFYPFLKFNLEKIINSLSLQGMHE